ncbi:MAG: patatin-like phospholipase family protein [Acidimicrobiia bacterium]|nr:patatin-like phospholipase family protein [Acidimicrobiia bacterium]
MKAYVVLDGGGVKGAALAGCLKAAEEHQIQFEGYGGTSAGSIVATLAAVGYTPDELRQVLVNELRFSSFLDDAGKSLAALRALGQRWYLPWLLGSHGKVAHRLYRRLGLYKGEQMRSFLLDRIGAKLEAVRQWSDVTFEQLRELGCKPLKIVATDLGARQARIHSAAGGHEINGSVPDAVRASTSYPFVFEPVKFNDRYLVDGGLSSNLPVFVFERERAHTRLPVIAFDLIQRPPDRHGMGRCSVPPPHIGARCHPLPRSTQAASGRNPLQRWNGEDARLFRFPTYTRVLPSSSKNVRSNPNRTMIDRSLSGIPS